MHLDFAPESLGKGSAEHAALIPVIPVIPVIPAGLPEGSHREGVGAGAELQGLLWALGWHRGFVEAPFVLFTPGNSPAEVPGKSFPNSEHGQRGLCCAALLLRTGATLQLPRPRPSPGLGLFL